jgi:hypothetical protein
MLRNTHIDRLVHHATILEMNAESFRPRAAASNMRISEIPDSDYANSRTAVSVISGQLGHD